MIVRFEIRKKKGTITVACGTASVDFPDNRTGGILEDMLNGVQDIRFKGVNIDGSERINMVNTIPAHDDGNLVNFLQQGVPGIKGRIRITGIEGSSKVSFAGNG